MRVGFVLRSTEIKPLFWDLCEIERDSSFKIESHSTKYYPCGFYYSTWREKDASDFSVWERREDRFLNMQNERETNAQQPPHTLPMKLLPLLFTTVHVRRHEIEAKRRTNARQDVQKMFCQGSVNLDSLFVRLKIVNLCSKMSHISSTRPHHHTNTGSHPNAEVKNGRAQSVRVWETRLEACVLSFFFCFPWFFLFSIFFLAAVVYRPCVIIANRDVFTKFLLRRADKVVFIFDCPGCPQKPASLRTMICPNKSPAVMYKAEAWDARRTRGHATQKKTLSPSIRWRGKIQKHAARIERWQILP